ncbi:MAG: ferrous iron transport protein B [Deltaproteobacteria bacterium]
MSAFIYKVALIGNPNSGKSSLFNSLTGLQQHVANFPGVTVDKKTSLLKIDKDVHILLTDFPGAYSLYPNSDDERVVAEILSNPANTDFPDAVIYVIDPFDFKRQLLLFTQLKDLKIPVLVVFTMKDLAEKQEIDVKTTKFENLFDSPAIFFSNKSKENLDVIKDKLIKLLENKKEVVPVYDLGMNEHKAVEYFRSSLECNSDYQALLQLHHSKWLKHLSQNLKEEIRDYKIKSGFSDLSLQINETLTRYKIFESKTGSIVARVKPEGKTITDRIDSIVTHRIAGPLIFFSIMLLVFQAIFSWATFPMDLIEVSFIRLSEFIKDNFHQNWLTLLFADGIIPGLAGVLVFVPQIFILFLIIAIMEEIGYMSRVIFMFDDLMRKFGMNGRSLVALISGGACAVPAIMSTRTISNWKERLITIMVTPLISCSARIPVYSLLVLFAVPDEKIWGFNLRGLTLMGLYLFGITMALFSSLVLNYFVRSRGQSYLILSLPGYKRPIIKNIALYVKEKLSAFVFGAGKIIVLISLVIWILASYGPGNNIEKSEQQAKSEAVEKRLNKEDTDNLIASKKLENSYIGVLGKLIEPAIQPIGFDWRIGIAIITSFAAREVFVGTMSTIYSIGSADDNVRISERMRKDINPSSGQLTYNNAVAWSLLMFYVFALQCVSTLAVVFRETNSWKWPFIQFLYMGSLAYFFSYLVYNLLK